MLRIVSINLALKKKKVGACTASTKNLSHVGLNTGETQTQMTYRGVEQELHMDMSRCVRRKYEIVVEKSLTPLTHLLDKKEYGGSDMMWSPARTPKRA
jgi:hypothetical protein